MFSLIHAQWLSEYMFIQDTTVAKLMKKIDDQGRMIREQGEMIKKLEETLTQYTKGKNAQSSSG